MQQNEPVETYQPLKEDWILIGSIKNVCSIHFLSGIAGIFVSMVNNSEITDKNPFYLPKSHLHESCSHVAKFKRLSGSGP